MSHNARSSLAQSRNLNDARVEARGGARGGLRARWPFYAGAAVIAVLALAYFDGGEEPIRPIAQPVELPGGNS